MGQKVNPHGLRVGVIKNWDSRWFAKNSEFGDLLVEDYNIRKYLKKTLYAAGVSNIEIERNANKVRIFIHCSRPGIVIGKGGSEIEKLKSILEKRIGKNINLSIVEIKNPDANATLVAENIASQLEKRISFRRAMKQCMGRAMRMGAKGIKTSCSGRLGGAEIARTEHYHEGTIPLHTLRADIDYGFAEANTTYGKIGVKVWIYKGEVLTGGPKLGRNIEIPKQGGDKRPRNNDRGDRRDNFRNDRRPYNNNNNNRGGQGTGGRSFAKPGYTNNNAGNTTNNSAPRTERPPSSRPEVRNEGGNN